LKQRAVTEFLSAEIHRSLQAVYGENTVNRTTVNRWAIKFRECELSPPPKKFKTAGKILLTLFGSHKEFT
jgi:transposase-like protein